MIFFAMKSSAKTVFLKEPFSIADGLFGMAIVGGLAALTAMVVGAAVVKKGGK